MKTKLRHLLTLGITLASLSSAHGQSFLTNGLIGYWPFNGNANDESGKTNYGLLVGSASLTSDRFGTPLSAVSLDGSFGEVTVPNRLLNIGWTQYSICGWFYTTNRIKQNQTILNTVPHNGLDLCYNHPYDGGTFVTAFVGNPTGWSVEAANGPKSDYISSNWYHFAIVRTNQNFHTYINGVLDNAFFAASAPTESVWCGLRFGSVGFNTGFWGYEVFSGKLDDFRLYNRALSPKEVEAIFNIDSKPSVALEKYVRPVYSNLITGTNYQLQVSADLLNWTNSGSNFTATNRMWSSPGFYPVAEWQQLYFRVQQVP